MQYSIYLFDFDGTLVDSRESLFPVFAAGYAAVGRKVTPEEVSQWMHISLPQSLALSGVPEKDHQKVIDAIIASLDLPESLDLIKLYDDVLPTLRRLAKEGKRIGVVSNNGSSHIRLVLERLHVDVPIACVVGSDMFSKGKPNREPIDMALGILGETDRSKVVYVGDSLQDPECGANAEIDGILIDRENVHPGFKGIRISSLDEL